MADEPQDDHAVEALITGMQGMLNRLKSDGPEPKNLKEAGDKAYGLMKASRLKAASKAE